MPLPPPFSSRLSESLEPSCHSFVASASTPASPHFSWRPPLLLHNPRSPVCHDTLLPAFRTLSSHDRPHMAAALVTSQITSVSAPPHVVSPRTALAAPPPYPTTSTASSSNSPRSPPPPALSAARSRRTHSQVIPQPSSSESSAPMTFKRLLRSPFEQTVRSGTRSKGKPTAPGNHILPITDTEVRVTQLMGREDGSKERTGILKRFESKVTLRRTRKVSDALYQVKISREKIIFLRKMERTNTDFACLGSRALSALRRRHCGLTKNCRPFRLK
ncbi:hypothetical protein BGY98DRAFT_1098221 [Russula aff. rugulosa BPL654]|nr:hypothetical protein BGY98DRAFT_1098221 [Russula aff. rugulosa BPL654]